MWYTALASEYAKSSPERPATSLYTWKSVEDFMIPEPKRSCSTTIIWIRMLLLNLKNMSINNKNEHLWNNTHNESSNIVPDWVLYRQLEEIRLNPGGILSDLHILFGSLWTIHKEDSKTSHHYIKLKEVISRSGLQYRKALEDLANLLVMHKAKHGTSSHGRIKKKQRRCKVVDYVHFLVK